MNISETHFRETPKTKKDLKTLQTKVDEFNYFLKKNKDSKFAGFMMLTSQNVDTYGAAVGLHSYIELHYLLVSLIIEVAISTGVDPLFVAKNILIEFEKDKNGTLAKELLETGKIKPNEVATYEQTPAQKASKE